MNRDEQEMALWREAYILAMSQTWACPKVDEAADAAVAAFRQRYPAEPAALPAVWYDEPPFPKDGKSYPCWIAGKLFPAAVFWNVDEWQISFGSEYHARSLRGRRVCPIVKPQEPVT